MAEALRGGRFRKSSRASVPSLQALTLCLYTLSQELDRSLGLSETLLEGEGGGSDECFESSEKLAEYRDLLREARTAVTAALAKQRFSAVPALSICGWLGARQNSAQGLALGEKVLKEVRGNQRFLRRGKMRNRSSTVFAFKSALSRVCSAPREGLL